MSDSLDIFNKYLVPNDIEYVKGVIHANTYWKYLVPNAAECQESHVCLQCK